MRIFVRLFALLILCLSMPSNAQQQAVERALPAILCLLLCEDEPAVTPPSLEDIPNVVTLFNNESSTNILFSNIADGQLTTCTSSPKLPNGLSVEVSPNGSSCRIVGTPTEVQAQTQFTITGSNAIGSSTATVSIEILSSEITMSGVISFDLVPTRTSGGVQLDYDAIESKPARAVTVQLLDINDNLLQSTFTDDLGNYSFTLAEEATVRIRVRAELLKDFGDGRYDVKVIDNTNDNALYTLAETSSSSARNNPVRNLHAASGWDLQADAYTSTRASAPFAMLESIYQAIEDVLVVDSDAVMPPLQVNWSINNRPASGNPATGAIGTSFYSANNLFILGAANSDTDEFDDHVIIHEWGHYFEDNLSRSDSIGGSHSGGQRLDMRVAFGEGFGNALSGIVTDDPLYVDTAGSNQASGFSINVESNPSGSTRGWYNESSVQSILYDLYDANNDGPDALELGFAPLYEVLVNEQKNTPFFTSIFSFVKAVRDNNPGQSVMIDSIVSGQNIVAAAIAADGAGETNDAGGGANALPVHTELTLGATSNVCVTTTLQPSSSRNKLSNHRFLSLVIPSNGDYDFVVEKSSSDYGTTDPDFILFLTGNALPPAQSGVDDSESGTINLLAGTYAIDLFDFKMTGTPPRQSGTACFDVTFSAN